MRCNADAEFTHLNFHKLTFYTHLSVKGQSIPSVDSVSIEFISSFI